MAGCEDKDWKMMHKETGKQMGSFWSGERDGKGQNEVTSLWVNGIVEPGVSCDGNEMKETEDGL